MTVCKRSALVSGGVLVCCLVFPSVGAAQGRDSLLNGTIAGLGVGLTAGAVIGFSDLGGPLSKRYCENESPGTNCTANAFVTTMVFGAIGAGLGALGLLASLVLARPELVAMAAPFLLVLFWGLAFAREPDFLVALEIDRERAVEGE